MDKKRVMTTTRLYTWAEFNWKRTQEKIEDQLAAVAPVDADGKYTHTETMVLSIAIITASGCKPVETLIHDHHRDPWNEVLMTLKDYFEKGIKRVQVEYRIEYETSKIVGVEGDEDVVEVEARNTVTSKTGSAKKRRVCFSI